MNCLGHEQITSLNTVKTLTIPTGTSYCLIQARTQNVYMTLDATTPASSNGIDLIAGQAPTILYQEALSGVKLLEAAGSAVVNVVYFGTNV